jgi:hypothetical protein
MRAFASRQGCWTAVGGGRHLGRHLPVGLAAFERTLEHARRISSLCRCFKSSHRHPLEVGIFLRDTLL